jgi:trehalose 6-phosphate phosphatase
MPRFLDNLSKIKTLLSTRPFGLITDIDGTISPTSTDPLHLVIPPVNRKYLKSLSEKLELVAINTGRSAAETRKLVDGDKILCVGQYGMEAWRKNKAVLDPKVKTFFADVREVADVIMLLSNLPGVIIQDKGLTLSIFYRLSPEPESTKKLILIVLNSIPEVTNLRIIEEKMVIGVVPPVNMDKGTAVRKIIRGNKLQGCIFLGDDTADVPAFRAIHRANKSPGFKGIAVAVIGDETAAVVKKEADYVLEGVKKATQFLKWLNTNAT